MRSTVNLTLIYKFDFFIDLHLTAVFANIIL